MGRRQGGGHLCALEEASRGARPADIYLTQGQEDGGSVWKPPSLGLRGGCLSTLGHVIARTRPNASEPGCASFPGDIGLLSSSYRFSNHTPLSRVLFSARTSVPKACHPCDCLMLPDHPRRVLTSPRDALVTPENRTLTRSWDKCIHSLPGATPSRLGSVSRIQDTSHGSLGPRPSSVLQLGPCPTLLCAAGLQHGGAQPRGGHAYNSRPSPSSSGTPFFP